MNFSAQRYQGTGINHDKEEFEGQFSVSSLAGTPSQSLSYTATRLSDRTVVHREIGLLTENEQGELQLHVHMEELPCTTVHQLKSQSQDCWVFEYHGQGKLAGFSSELVFQFEGEKFKYLHRWAMAGEVSDKSWCLLERVE